MKTKGPQANPGCLPGAETFTIKEECGETGGTGERKRTSETREKPRFPLSVMVFQGPKPAALTGDKSRKPTMVLSGIITWE